MRRTISVLLLVFFVIGLVAGTASANGRRAILKDSNGNPTGLTLVLCANPTGGITASVVGADGTTICGPSRIHRIRPGIYVFACNGSRFLFGCRSGACGWRYNGRTGQLCPAS